MITQDVIINCCPCHQAPAAPACKNAEAAQHPCTLACDRLVRDTRRASLLAHETRQTL